MIPFWQVRATSKARHRLEIEQIGDSTMGANDKSMANLLAIFNRFLGDAMEERGECPCCRRAVTPELVRGLLDE